MKLKMALVLGAAGAVIGYLIFKAARDGVKAAAQAVNPLSDKNAAYTAVNAAGEAITGNKDFSLGSAIYDWFHEEYDPNAPNQTRKQAVGDNFYLKGFFE